MEFRQFFSKVGVQPAATSSAYIETQSTTRSHGEEIVRATKLSCAIYGPM